MTPDEHRMMQETHDEVVNLRNSIDTCVKRINEIDRVVFKGNGQRSLLSGLTDHSTRIKTIEERNTVMDDRAHSADLAERGRNTAMTVTFITASVAIVIFLLERFSVI